LGKTSNIEIQGILERSQASLSRKSGQAQKASPVPANASVTWPDAALIGRAGRFVFVKDLLSG
jgi:hypothetical protein